MVRESLQPGELEALLEQSRAAEADLKRQYDKAPEHARAILGLQKTMQSMQTQIILLTQSADNLTKRVIALENK